MQAAPGQPFFGAVLMDLSRQWRKALHQRLAQMGLTDTSWVPLFHLHQTGEAITLKALAQRMGLESSTLVRVVDLLEAKGWLQRQADPHDRRNKHLTLTEAGRQAVQDILGKLQQAESDLLAGMQAAQVQRLHGDMLALSERLAAASPAADADADESAVTEPGGTR